MNLNGGRLTCAALCRGGELFQGPKQTLNYTIPMAPRFGADLPVASATKIMSGSSKCVRRRHYWVTHDQGLTPYVKWVAGQTLAACMVWHPAS
jgi:hypothetical protein